MALTLYDLAGADPAIRFSPHCWRTRMALAHKGLEVDCVPWRFREKEAISFSGQGVVPVLVDGADTVVDSWDIAVHLDHRHPDRPHLFDREQSRAHALFLNHWTARVLHAGLIRHILLDIYSLIDEGDKAYFRESREKRFGMTLEEFAAGAELPAFRASLAPLRATLEAQDYLGGHAASYADYIVFGAFQWARVCSAKQLLEEGDPIGAWQERMLGLHDGLAAAMPARGRT